MNLTVFKYTGAIPDETIAAPQPRMGEQDLYQLSCVSLDSTVYGTVLTFVEKKKSITAAVVKGLVDELEADNQGYLFTAHQRKVIAAEIRAELLPKQLPTTTEYMVLFMKGYVVVSTRSSTAVGHLLHALRLHVDVQTFEHLRPTPVDMACLWEHGSVWDYNIAGTISMIHPSASAANITESNKTSSAVTDLLQRGYTASSFTMQDDTSSFYIATSGLSKAELSQATKHETATYAEDIGKDRQIVEYAVLAQLIVPAYAEVCCGR